MDPVTVGILGVLVFFVMLAIGMQIGAAMGFCGFFGFVLIIGWDSAFYKIGSVTYETVSNYELATIPLFVFMAHSLFKSGFTDPLFELVHRWIGRLPGGLAIASIVACGIFSAISASSMATAVTMALVALPQMKKHGYHDTISYGAIAAGGTLGVMIPPSGMLIAYGIITGESIGKLFMAGILPGITLIFLMGLVVFGICVIRPDLGPKGDKFTFREKIAPLFQCCEIILIILFVLGGLFIGWFTPTEAAAVGASGAFIFSILRKRLTWPVFIETCYGTAKTASMVYILIIGAMLFNYFMTASTLPTQLSGWVASLGCNRIVIILIIAVIFFILGMFIDALAMILLTMPVFFPLILVLGFDPIWFGIFVVVMCEIAVISPPVGMNLIALASIFPDVGMGTIIKGVLPLFIAFFVMIFILIAFPEIVLWLPGISA